MLRRAIDGWLRTPIWWKGFYLAFPVSFAFIYASTLDATFAIRAAFAWSLMISAALWASEALKLRLRERRNRPPDSTLPHGVDPNDLRRRR
ncbi:MAG: hypothetical protein U0360_11500 [Dehalococcoidia bacterium]